MKAIPKSKPRTPRNMTDRTAWSATSHKHFKPVPHSGYAGIGNPRGVNKAEMMTPHDHFEPVDHSMPAVPRKPKKWRP